MIRSFRTLSVGGDFVVVALAAAIFAAVLAGACAAVAIWP